ncbi:MAG: isoprenylcysteine carboxylmethyltransferase family protein [Candidatus Ranarchaeia archaeon]
MTDLFFRVLFFSIFAAFWTIRILYIRKTRDPDAPRSGAERRAAMRKEGWSGVLIVILTPITFILIVLFVWSPSWMVWADLTFSDWVHWLGALLSISSIPLMMWVHRTLGQQYSYALETKDEQKLVTAGPYKRVRHPLYSAHNLFNLGTIFLTANIPLIFFAIIGIPLTYVRMKDEERMMVEKFGSEYEQYMKKTGRIFPKL